MRGRKGWDLTDAEQERIRECVEKHLIPYCIKDYRSEHDVAESVRDFSRCVVEARFDMDWMIYSENSRRPASERRRIVRRIREVLERRIALLWDVSHKDYSYLSHQDSNPEAPHLIEPLLALARELAGIKGGGAKLLRESRKKRGLPNMRDVEDLGDLPHGWC